MAHPTDSLQQYVSLGDRLPPGQPTGLVGSIWAPQPHKSDTTWRRVLSRVAEVHNRSDAHNESLQVDPLTSREDLFGYPTASQNGSRDISAIKDGRMQNNPEYDDEQHVEQLLRTLNLNSPAPFAQNRPYPLVASADVSPNLSPASVCSALATPTELSPIGRPLDSRLHSPCEPTQPDHSFIMPPLAHLSYLHASSGLHRPLVDSSGPNGLTHSSHLDFSYSMYNFPPRQTEQSCLPCGQHRSTQRVHSLASFSQDWRLQNDKSGNDSDLRMVQEEVLRPFVHKRQYNQQSFQTSKEPINFLSLLHSSSSSPHYVFVARIIQFSDQQASIFLQQKLKVADFQERIKIVDAICARGFEMMTHRFGNWAVQRCLEAASRPEERRKIVSCMRGRIVDLATNCYGSHVLQRALDFEEDIRFLIVSELLHGDSAQTIVNKHASHVWSKVLELSWTPSAPPIFASVNKTLKGKWASLACHEVGSLVVQHAFENLEAEAKDGIIDELLNQGFVTFSEVVKSQWGSYCIQHILEHGFDRHQRMALEHILEGLLEFATDEQGSKSVTKALKKGDDETLAKFVRRMCEPATGARRAMIVDLALSVTGSQMLASVVAGANKDQRCLLYESIKGHIVTLRSRKTGSEVIWLFNRMCAY